jgi:hypothetical protein
VPLFDSLVIAVKAVEHFTEPSFSYVIMFRCIDFFFLSELAVESVIPQLLSAGEFSAL